MNASAAEEPKRKSLRASLAAYGDRRVLAMLFLGFSAGLPFLLVFGTLSAWLREAGISRTTIGFLVLTTFAYSLKFVWAPLVDRLPLPYLNRRLGRRRAWMLVSQCAIAAGLLGMAFTNPGTNLPMMAAFTVLTAFGSATQDIAIDAFRIESVPADMQGATAGAYQLGYRIALLAAGAGALYIAEFVDWRAAYLSMAVLVGVGMTTVFIVREPAARFDPDAEQRAAALVGASAGRSALGRAAAWFASAVIGPFLDFFTRHGWMALVILLFIGSFRLADITMGVMANPFYIDVGFSKTDIANVSKLYGIWMGIAGALLGGVVVARFGILRPLFVCAILAACSNLLFYWVAVDGREMLDLGRCFDALCLPDDPWAVKGGDIGKLVITISAENLIGGMAGTVLIAYLSGLTNAAYTATQYALFSSFMSLVGKMVASTSGLIVDETSYPFFFVYTTLMGIPAVILVLVLIASAKRIPRRAALAPAAAVAAAPRAGE